VKCVDSRVMSETRPRSRDDGDDVEMMLVGGNGGDDEGATSFLGIKNAHSEGVFIYNFE